MSQPLLITNRVRLLSHPRITGKIVEICEGMVRMKLDLLSLLLVWFDNLSPHPRRYFGAAGKYRIGRLVWVPFEELELV